MVYERLVIILSALIGVVIGTYITFKSGNPGYILGFSILPFAILLIGKARLHIQEPPHSGQLDPE